MYSFLPHSSEEESRTVLGQIPKKENGEPAEEMGNKHYQISEHQRFPPGKVSAEAKSDWKMLLWRLGCWLAQLPHINSACGN